MQVDLSEVLELIEEYRDDQVMSKYFNIKECQAARNTIDRVKEIVQAHFEEKK